MPGSDQYADKRQELQDKIATKKSERSACTTDACRDIKQWELEELEAQLAEVPPAPTLTGLSFDTDKRPFPQPGDPDYHRARPHPSERITQGSWYKIKMEAYDADGDHIVSSHVVRARANDIEQVKSLTVAAGVREAVLEWPWTNRSGACDKGVCPGDSYEVQWRSITAGEPWPPFPSGNDPCSHEEKAQCMVTDVRNATVTGLLADNEYAFRVRAVIKDNRPRKLQGLWSDEVTAEILDDDDVDDFYFKMEYPEGYLVYEVEDGLETCFRLYDRETDEQVLGVDRTYQLSVETSEVYPDPAILNLDYTLPVGLRRATGVYDEDENEIYEILPLVYTVEAEDEDNLDCFRFGLIDSWIEEPTEQFDFRVSARGVGASGWTRVTIEDDDTTGPIQLSFKECPGGEGEDGCTFTEGTRSIKAEIEIQSDPDDDGTYTPHAVPEDTLLLVRTVGTATKGKDYTLPESPKITMGASSVVLDFGNINSNFEVERDEHIDVTVLADGADPLRFRITIKDNDVVEMRIDKVSYETTEGSASRTISIVMVSDNAAVSCLIGFPVKAYICSTDYTATLSPPEATRGEAYEKCYANQPESHSASEVAYSEPDNSDGRHIAHLLEFPACSRKQSITWTAADDDMVERQREQFYVSIHPYEESPAGLRVNSRSVVDLLDNDRSKLSLVDDSDGDGQVEYTVNDGSIIDIPYAWSKPIEYRFTWGLNQNTDVANDDVDAVQESRDDQDMVACMGDWRYLNDNISKRSTDCAVDSYGGTVTEEPPVAVRSNITIQTNVVSEDKTLYLDADYTPLLFTEGLKRQDPARIKLTIQPADGIAHQRRAIDGSDDDLVSAPQEELSMSVVDNRIWRESRNPLRYHWHESSTVNDRVPDDWNIYGQPLEFDGVRLRSDGMFFVDIDPVDGSADALIGVLDPGRTYEITAESGGSSITLEYAGDMSGVWAPPDNNVNINGFLQGLTHKAEGKVTIREAVQ